MITTLHQTVTSESCSTDQNKRNSKNKIIKALFKEEGLPELYEQYLTIWLGDGESWEENGRVAAPPNLDVGCDAHDWGLENGTAGRSYSNGKCG
ncbi:hypothetical protein GUJ93_ZPchr0001g29773 [Zizania palustris]|uniref:Uncharacterized protein n=1 Tax=Zizania palustris TaxID=103762 RepID=A0A8J5VLX7_ZIZPA|nr:hypothetical protein GUJ93_ZPchr0001g29773 [Zizania palustris]